MTTTRLYPSVPGELLHLLVQLSFCRVVSIVQPVSGTNEEATEPLQNEDLQSRICIFKALMGLIGCHARKRAFLPAFLNVYHMFGQTYVERLWEHEDQKATGDARCGKDERW